jgi:hypothetical protein
LSRSEALGVRSFFLVTRGILYLLGEGQNYVKEDKHMNLGLRTVGLAEFTCVEPGEQIEGAYLFYDRENGIFVRSGKASPTYIHDRGEQHRASAQTSVKGFYGKYPDASNPNIRDGLRRGYFSNLQLLYAIGFKRSNVKHLISSSKEDGGVFDWDDATLSCIRRSRIDATEDGKRTQMIAYLFELVYDLMIAPDDNVSVNAGGAGLNHSMESFSTHKCITTIVVINMYSETQRTFANSTMVDC